MRSLRSRLRGWLPERLDDSGLGWLVPPVCGLLESRDLAELIFQVFEK